MVVMVMGLPGSGKSYFAEQLAELIHAEYINSDRVRLEILRYVTYSDKEKRMVYKEMLRLGEEAIRAGRDVVLDATFYKEEIRDVFSMVLDRVDRLVWIEITADEQVIRGRLRYPRKDSDANFEVYKDLKKEWQPLTSAHLVLRSTNENIDNMLDQAMEYLH